MLEGLLATFVYSVGMKVLDMCREAKECQIEVARIAIRTQNALASLELAKKTFGGQAEGLDANLIELRDVLETVTGLVGRCCLATTKKKRGKISLLRKSNDNRGALIAAEKKLERITQILGIPLLTGIRQQLTQMQEATESSKVRDAEYVAKIVGEEIRKAMMAVNRNGVTIEATLASACEQQRAPPAEMRGGGVEGGRGSHDVQEHTAREGEGACAPSQKFGSMMMAVGRVRFDHLVVNKDEELLGEGTFGMVMPGTYYGQDVAVKKARDFRGSARVKELFRREVEIQYAMRHPNIVEVIAFDLGDKESPPCLVMELMEETLYDLLGTDGIVLDPIDKVQILRDVSEGVQFLHRRGIIHRDLKSLNVLLNYDERTGDRTAKISDFGLAKVNSAITTATGCGLGVHSKVGSDFWMAPEVYSTGQTFLASDIFSLHVVMWEVLTHSIVGGGKPIGDRLQTDPGAHLRFDGMDCSPVVESHLKNIAWKCGYYDQSDRPKMAEVCSVLSAVLDHLECPEENPLEEVAPSPTQLPRQQAEAQRQQQPQSPAQKQQEQHTRPEEHQEQPLQKGNEPPRQPQQQPQHQAEQQAQGKEEQVHEWEEKEHRQTVRQEQGKAQKEDGGQQKEQGECQTEPEEQQQQQRHPPLSFMERVLHGAKERRLSSGNNLGTVETTGFSTGSNISSWSSKSAARPSQRAYSLDETRPTLARASARRFDSVDSYQCTIGEEGSLSREISRESVDPLPVTLQGDRAVLFKLLRVWAPSSIANNLTARSEWVNSTGWGTRIAMKHWHGVDARDVNEEGAVIERVTAIILPMNGLCGDLPEDVMTLDFLVILNLRDNGLTGVLSASLANLRSLQTLDLSGNNLKGTIPRELGELVHLVFLSLSQNPLEEYIPETLGNLPLLETLDLSNCQLCGRIPTEFEGLRALQVLRLECNGLTGKIPASLAKLDNLSEIYLSGNRLTGNILAVSRSWPALRVLDMSDNRLEGRIPREIVEFKCLTNLRLYRNCNVKGTIPPWIGRMTLLEELDLSAMQLGGEIPKEIGQLTRLTSLRLGSCGLVGTVPVELGRLPTLKHLALFDNNLTGVIPRPVLKIPTLRIFHVENNDFEVKKAMVRGAKGTIKSTLPWGCNVRL